MLSDRPASMNSQEHAQLLKALRESELLRELAELLASSLDPTHILQVLVKRTTEACEVGRCAVWLLDESQQRFLPSAYHMSTHNLKAKSLQTADQVWHRSSLPFDNPLIECLLQEQGLLVLEDLRTHDSMKTIAEKFFVRSVLLVALLREGRPVGMMSLDHPSKLASFSKEQQQLARAIGQQAALAIDNARLYQQAQDEQQRAERLIERAQLTSKVALAVNSDQDLPSVLQIAAHHLMQGAQATGAAITQLSQQNLSIANTVFASPNVPQKQEVVFSLPLDALPSCQAAMTQTEPLFIPQHQQNSAEQRWFQQLGMTHVLIAPMLASTQSTSNPGITEQSCLGFAFINYPYSRPAPGGGKRAFAHAIAAQCALAIVKARILQETRQAVALATERANTLDAVFHAMTEGIILCDNQGQVLLHNEPAAPFVTALPPQNSGSETTYILNMQEVSTPYGQPFTKDDHPFTRALHGQRIRGERLFLKDCDNSENATEVNIAPLLDSQEQQIGFVGAFRDITEQVRSEQRTRRALDTMLQAANVVSGLTDVREIAYRVLAMTLTALSCERGAVQLYRAEEQCFTPLLSIGFDLGETEQWLAEQQCWQFPDHPQHSHVHAQLLAGHATLVNPETPHDLLSAPILAAPLMYNNRLLGVMLLDRTTSAFQPHKQDATTGLSRLQPGYEFSAWDMAVVEGIAQFAALAIEQTHWQQEAEIARTNEATMRETSELKDEFLAITAHEFRTPLTIIQAHSQMMGRLLHKSQQSPEKLKERLNESITYIGEQTYQLTNIVNTFLEVTRLNRGQIALNLEEIQLDEIAREVVAHHRTTSTKHEIRSRIESGKRPYLLMGDKARLTQIFGNLLQNAIKYSPLGGPITVFLKQCVDNEGRSIAEVTIEDKGIGVPKDAQPHLFERFYRAPNIGGSQARGVGLGLYVVAEFLRLHGGTIRVVSNGVEGEGSRFIFTLPLLEKTDSTSSKS